MQHKHAHSKKNTDKAIFLYKNIGYKNAWNSVQTFNSLLIKSGAVACLDSLYSFG